MRPFFSVIISCYNSKDTLQPLLQSIVKQYLSKDELEVIISDDHSTQSYQSIIDRYKNILNIKQVETDYNCCPGNTRQRGSQAATGEWIIFSDHDDEFIENTFFIVREQILKNKIDSFVTTSFIHRNFDTKQDIRIYSADEVRTLSWTHGKFYNLDNFWKKYNLHYLKDLSSHQDVYLSTSIDTIVQTFNISSLNIDISTYIWYWRKDSLSNQSYQTNGHERRFIDKFLVDYLTATIGVYFERNEIYHLDKDYFRIGCCQVIMYCYYYLEQAKYINPVPLKENYQKIKEYLDLIKKQFNLTGTDINMLFVTDRTYYQRVYKSALIATGYFLPQITFLDWITNIQNGNF